MIYNFYTVLIFSIVLFFLSIILVTLNDLPDNFGADYDKNSPYECGFRPFDLNLQQFDIKYYIVGLLFLIFDIETIFLLPFISIQGYCNIFIFFNMIFFIFILFIGLLYEWKNKFLDWE